MGKRGKYSVEINRNVKKANRVAFDYRNTKDIKLSVSNNCAVASVEYGSKSDSIDVNLEEKTVIRAIVLKAALAHLMLFDKPLVIKRIVLYKDGFVVDSREYDESHPCLHCVVETPFYLSLSDAWKTTGFIDGVLHLKNTKDKQLLASIYSFLCSRGSKYEYLRFVNLWTAINGLYGHLYPKTDTRPHEAEQIKNIIRVKELGESFPTRNENNEVVAKILPLITSIIDDNITVDYFSQPEHEEIDRNIQQLLSQKCKGHNLTTYGYLLFGLPYYYRCQLIHAGTPIPLFSVGSEVELRRIRFMNRIMDSFLEESLTIEVNRIRDN